MTDKPSPTAGPELIHLPKTRNRKSLSEQIAQEVELSIAGHFHEQNQLLQAMNSEMSAQIRRLTIGIERLVEEMNGVRTGKKDEAFARVAPPEASPDLPTVSAEAALIYTLTSDDIGRELGFRSSQIGLFLSAHGLGWAGNSDYQELGRHKKKNQTKFWHREVTERLRRILDEGSPERFGITDKSVLAIFRRWNERKASHELLENLEPIGSPN